MQGMFDGLGTQLLIIAVVLLSIAFGLGALVSYLIF